MSRVVYAFLLVASLSCAVAAQTRRGTTAAPAQTRPAQTPATRPAQTPAQRPATTTPQPAPAAPAPQPAGFDACGCEAGPLPEVLGTVNGVKLTRADLSSQTQQRVAQLQQEVVDARRGELDRQINSILVDAESKKRNTSPLKLLEAEVLQKVQPPTDAEAQAYFDQNKARIEAQAGSAVTFAQLKQNILEYLREQRTQERARQFAEALRAAAQVKKNVESATPPAAPADRARVFATVNGRNITSGDIEDALLPLVAAVQEQVYVVRKAELDMKINDILLNAEAAKRGVTARAVLDAEVTAKLPTITDAQAQDFYNKNRGRINGDFAAIKAQIVEYLGQQEQQRLEGAFVERLRNGASVQTFVTPPPAPVFAISTDDQPAKGNPNAAVTIIEFTDYQCPTCAATKPIVERLLTEYGDRVRLVVRDFPLEMHPEARKAAEAAEAAREQGKYWDFTAILFRNQSALKPAQLKQYAQVIGLDRAKFDAALDTGKFSDKVERDILDGQRFGISGTPTFFVNGRRAKDASYETLKAAIEAALKK